MCIAACASGLAQASRLVASPRARFAWPRSRGEIDAYLATGLWEGKAGAFGLQDRPTWLKIESGSESNVIGLPLELLAEMLAEMPGKPCR